MLGLTSKIAEDSLNFVYDDKINPNSPAYKELQDLMEDHKYFQKRMKNIENNYKAGDIYRNETQYLEAKNKVQESINSVVNRMQQITGDAKSITVKGYKYDADPKATDLKPKTNETTEVKPVQRVGNWTRAEVEADKDFTYLFGDNTADRSSGVVPTKTQAVIRGLDNAVGIDTRLSRTEDWVDNDANYNKFTQHVDEQIQKALDMGKPIKVSAGGMGTGMAKALPPRFKEYLDNAIKNIGTGNVTPEVKQSLPDNVVETTEDFRKMFNRYGPGGMPPLDTPEFGTWYEKEIEGKSSTEIIDDVAKNADVEPSLLRKSMGEVPGFLVVPLEAAIEVGLRYGRLGKRYPNVAKNARRFIMYELGMFAAAVVTGVVTYGANKFRAETGFDSREIYTPYSYKGTDEANQKMEEAVAYNAEIQKIYEEYPELKKLENNMQIRNFLVKVVGEQHLHNLNCTNLQLEV